MSRVFQIFLMSIILVGCGDKQPSKPAGKIVDGENLWQDYEKNPVNGDEKYKGKLVKLTGAMGEISAKFIQYDDESALGLMCFTPTAFQDAVPPNIICKIDPAARSQFAKLKDDDFFTIVGICQGIKNDPRVYKKYVIILTGCSLDGEPKKPAKQPPKAAELKSRDTPKIDPENPNKDMFMDPLPTVKTRPRPQPKEGNLSPVEEQRARSDMKTAKTFIASDNKAAARNVLKDVIKTWPGSSVAREAQVLLDGLAP